MRDRQLRRCHQLLEYLLVMLQQALDGGGLKQVGRILHYHAQLRALAIKLQIQLGFGDRHSPEEGVAIASAVLRPAMQRHVRKVLMPRHDRHERCLAAVALQLQSIEQVLKRQPLVLIPLKRHRLDPL